MSYPPMLIKPFREELTSLGIQELLTAAAVDVWMAPTSGTALLVFNCADGCAAGVARPGVREALGSAPRKPDRMASVFAGQDLEATAKARAFLADIPPSEPSIALFKDGELVYFMPRQRIEGHNAHEVARNLVQMFEEFCT